MDAEAAKAQVRAQVAAVLEDRKVGDVVYFLGQLLELEFLDSPLIQAVQRRPAADAAPPPRRHQALPRGRRAARPAPKPRHPRRSRRRSERNAAARGPIVLVFDDLHFAHDESLDLLAYLVEYLSTRRSSILCLARPEMLARHDGWAKHGGERHKVVELSPLSRHRRGAR